MFAAKREQAIYEAAILEHLSRLEQRIDQISQQRTSSTSGILPSVLSAGSSVNGTVTVGDVLVSGAIFVVGAGAGAVAAPVLYAAGVPWDDATIALRIGTYGGLGLCWLKLAVDGLLYDVFNSWRNRPEEEKPAPPTNTVVDRPFPIYDKDHEPPIEVRLCGLPNGRTIAWDDLTDYLETAQANFARWGTKAWSREAWVGKPYPEYPQLGNIPSRTWTGVLQLCTEWIKQFPAYTDKAGRSLVWQTGDPTIIRDFVDLLDAEL